MFTGIIEHIGEVVSLEREQDNLHISMRTPITSELKIDQSVAHNGVCLTVVAIKDDVYTVTAIKETLDKSNLGQLEVGHKVNIERCMKLGDRLDGHIVQGHVDQTAQCTHIRQEQGWHTYTFEYTPSQNITCRERLCMCQWGEFDGGQFSKKQLFGSHHTLHLRAYQFSAFRSW